jgi:nicotinamidase-related amidase/predicted MFS family arabinose efflux permease
MTSQEPSQADGAGAFSWRFNAPLFLGAALNPINSSLIATALVPIAAAMHVPVGRTAVLVASLYLASSIAQPTGGKLAEEFGPRRVFLAGILIVLAGGVVGGTGQDLTTLIVSRVLIGIGTSAGYPSAMLLIRRRAEWAGMDAPPGGVLGGLAIAATALATLGLPIGGVLVGAWGWRTTFLINVPVGLVALAMTALWIPRDAPVEGSRMARDVAARIDVAGIAGFGGAMTGLLVFLLSLPRPDWVALGVAVVLFGCLVRWELRARRPFFDVRLLTSNLALTRTYARIGLTLLCLYTVIYGVTQWLEAGRGMSAYAAGLLLLPCTGVSAVISRPISKRNLVRGPLIVAAASSLVASAGVFFLTTSTAVGWIVVITLIFGITMGTTAIGNQTALYTQVAADQIGTASGLFRTFGYVGSIASSAIIGIVFHKSVTDHGLHVIAIIMIAVSAVALLITLADRRLRTPAPAGTAGTAPNQENRGNHMTDTLPAIDPRHAALLVMDYQPAIVGRLADAEALLSRVAAAIGAVRRRGGQIGYVRVAFDDADYDAIPAHSPMATAVAAAGRAMHADSPTTAVHDHVAPEPGDIIVRKTRVGAFSTTDLGDQLQARGITTLILAGIATSGVVLSTVRDAADRDYQVFVLADASADPDPDVHDFLTEKIFPRQAHVITIADLTDLLRTPGRAH